MKKTCQLMPVYHLEKPSTMSEGTLLIYKCTTQYLTQKCTSGIKNWCQRFHCLKLNCICEQHACFPLKVESDRFNCRQIVSRITWGGENHIRVHLPTILCLLSSTIDQQQSKGLLLVHIYIIPFSFKCLQFLFVFTQRENYFSIESLFTTFNKQRFLP